MGPAKTRIAGRLSLPVDEVLSGEGGLGNSGFKVSTNVGVSMAQRMLVRVQL